MSLIDWLMFFEKAAAHDEAGQDMYAKRFHLSC